jgi:hypothetical protein
MHPPKLTLLLALLPLASCASGGGGRSSAPEWRSLFDGETTAGWVNYNSDSIRDGWKVEDGALVIDGPGGDIVTVDEFRDFELELEWQVAEGGNSGIFYNVVDGLGAVWASGPEMQILDNERHHDGQNALTSAGACYALYAPPVDVTRPVGEWNEVRLVSRGGEVEHWLNGTLVCSYTLRSDDWNTRVAGSKFKDMADFGMSRSGRIALQDHGDRVAFRNIRIREFWLEASEQELSGVACICGTPAAALESCACPLCAGGEGNPANDDCVCDALELE